MKRLEYKIGFTTPAFLGNAGQQAQWRTPPFKALIRQWWRVLAAKECDYDHRKLREKEGILFGNAWLKSPNDELLHRKSDLRVRVIPWSEGQLNSDGWPGGPMEQVPTTPDGKRSVRADVYLGFGPVLPPSTKENRPKIALRGLAISPDENMAQLQLLFTNETMNISGVVQLIAWFGTLGSRARNGWGLCVWSAAEIHQSLVEFQTQTTRACVTFRATG